ncbi:UNVERIFIED_CONTAM: hypothetical protein Scaly_0029700 [Sesamum calycinum]|uniref:Uncharacterized protein n=1 Tax=Sesamum calycinum TaxID=2727403 RepID=A0AAW2STQ0_9LAMI
MAALIYQIFSSSALLSQGLYHLVCTTKNHLKSPRDYVAKPYHPFPTTTHPHHHPHRFLKHLQLYLIILCLFIALLHHLIVSSYADPSSRAALLSTFSRLSRPLPYSSPSFSSPSLSSSPMPPPSSLFRPIFFSRLPPPSSSSSTRSPPPLPPCRPQISRPSASPSLRASPPSPPPYAWPSRARLFVADVALGASFCLQGLWALQTGLSLYVDAFIPEGCHKLLDVVSGVEGSTKCDLEDSKLRAVAILDLVFVLHVLFVLLIFFVVYSAIAKTLGTRSRFGSYEALPNTAVDSSHIQLKAMTGTQA